jgi:hypothetical protein
MSTAGQVCPEDMYPNSAASLCLHCPFGSVSPAGSVAITACTCTTGFTGPSGGPCKLTNIHTCPIGRYEAVTPTATVTCSGGCCEPQHGTSTSGIISDGTGNVRNSEFCRWIIVSTDSSVVISVVFSYLQIWNVYDYIKMWECQFNTNWCSLSTCADSACSYGVETAAFRYSFSTPTVYISNTPLLYVEFRSHNVRGPYSSSSYKGFMAKWTQCVVCPANTNSIDSRQSITDCVCNAGYTGPNGGPCMAWCLTDTLSTSGFTTTPMINAILSFCGDKFVFKHSPGLLVCEASVQDRVYSLLMQMQTPYNLGLPDVLASSLTDACVSKFGVRTAQFGLPPDVLRSSVLQLSGDCLFYAFSPTDVYCVRRAGGVKRLKW